MFSRGSKLVQLSAAVVVFGLGIGLGCPGEVRAEIEAFSNQIQNLDRFSFQAPDGSGGGSPSKRRDAGSRGPCQAAHLTSKEMLTALIPEQDSHSLTVDAQPTLWFYVPYRDIRPMQLVLRDENDENIETVALVPDEALPGIIRVRLASTLAVGERYNWMFSFECQVDDETSDADIKEFFVEGTVERVSPSDTLALALENAQTERDRAAAYARNGMWFDALTLLGNLQRSGSGNADAWTELLGSVGLKDMTSKPIVDCCRPQ